MSTTLAGRVRTVVLLVALAATSACGTWSQYRGSESRTGFQPFEFSLNPSNVAQLTPQWSADLGGYDEDFSTNSSPTVANGVLYAGSSNGSLRAFDAGGTKGCSGTPKTCAPLWSGATAGPPSTSTPAVANGIVYSTASDSLYAFDATGTTGCSGVPKTCAPLWSASGVYSTASPAVANGFVYLTTFDGRLVAFDAAGQRGCTGTPTTCSPIWTGLVGARLDASPAVANGVVYVGSTDGRLYAFDAAGTLGCAGVPTTCSPRWTAATTGSIRATPAVANGVVYVGSLNHRLYAFDATGSSGCSGVPKACAPLWQAELGEVFYESPAVAYGTVYVNGGSRLSAFDAAGTTGCSGAPKLCTPLWTTVAAPVGFLGYTAPAVANGVVYADAFVNGLHQLAAFDAAGTSGCTGPPPKSCAPLWTSPSFGQSETTLSPTIANGVVYGVDFGGRAFTLRAFARPPG